MESGYDGAGGAGAVQPTKSVALDLGDVLRDVLKAIGGTLPLALPIVFVLQIPYFIAHIVSSEYQATIDPTSLQDPQVLLPYFGSVFALAMVSVVSGILAQAALVHLVVDFIAGKKSSFGEAIAVAIKNFGTLLVLAIVLALATTAGALLCIVPMFFVIVVLYLAVPAAVVEGAGPIEALTRSIDLTEGNRLPIFALLMVIGSAMGVVGCVVFGSVGAVSGVLTVQNGGVAPLSARILNYAVTLPFSVFPVLLNNTLVGVVYARIRGIRDGVDPEQLAEVFA